MPDDREERIRARAHQLWESEGRPSGREAEHWEQARREIEAEEAGRTPSDSSGAGGGLGHEEMTADVQSGGAGALGEAASPAGTAEESPQGNAEPEGGAGTSPRQRKHSDAQSE